MKINMKWLVLTIIVLLVLMAGLVKAACDPNLRCVWPDGSQTLPDYYTCTCPAGSVPMTN